MKKIIFSLIVVLTAMNSITNAQESFKEKSTEKNLSSVKYRLFPTQNMWTFIKLNTRNGQMWQVQYDVEDDNRFESYLNVLPLIDKDKEINDRFTLYSTENIYTFILLDQFDGRMWQVQWSLELENRVIFPIE